VTEPLPVDAVLPALLDALRARRMAVLEAPPGAGKTTRVPLALRDAGLTAGRIVMLEPRRLAARAAAQRMAETLGEPVGRSIGLRMRGETRVSRHTRIEVVTEAVLTRMLQDDPGLDGIGALIFDEFHERSLHADLGLALALDVRAALRDDLILLPMSATLDAAPLAELMDGAPRIRAEGRAFPVETRWLARPAGPALEPAVAALVLEALAAGPGDLLAFLPGEAEIRRTAAALAGRTPGCAVRPLYGAMGLAAQTAALAPEPGGARKIVLATAIAETSLTIPGIRLVVDGGRARRARFDPASGMTRLVTERVTRAEADQRRGRAGRTAPGLCFRLWTKGEEGALAAFPPPEIASADLAGLALDLALWGGGQGLRFLTPPPAAALAEARALLAAIGALDAQGRITGHGRALAALPLHPRLAGMLLRAGPQAATLAALLAERDPLRGAPPDLALRLAALRGERTPYPLDPAAADRIRAEARRLSRLDLPADPGAAAPAGLSAGGMAALAYPDRIAQRRDGEAPRFLLAAGKGARMEPGTPLAAAPLIVATDLDGDPREALIRLAAELPEAEFRTLFAGRIRWEETCRWSPRDRQVLARRVERFAALTLAERPWPEAPPAALARAALEGLRQIGLPWSPGARRLAARIRLAAGRQPGWPATDEATLLAEGADWLLPHLAGRRSEADLRALDLAPALAARLTWEQTQTLDRLAPSHYETPLGRRIPIDYDGDVPAVELRLQELFGETRHPVVGAERLPLRLTLLSPGGRPVQVTQDLPGFWASSYAEVRRDMRGRYPRHPWPEDPRAADPTLRAKPRGT
jgi:ATP-dependent helicase HrpB